jgi:cysteine desulfurase
VLEALGLDQAWTRGGLRLTLGHQNTAEEIEYTITTMIQAVQTLQAIERSFA